MLIKKIAILIIQLTICVICNAQLKIDSSLIYNKNRQLDSLYVELMRNATQIRIVDANYGPVISPIDHLNGEGVFVFEIDSNSKVLNVLITEFKSYSTFNDKIEVKDYIVFVDGDSIGFTQDKLHTYRMNPSSVEVIDKLFERTKSFQNFQIRKRQAGIYRKYLRIPFE